MFGLTGAQIIALIALALLILCILYFIGYTVAAVLQSIADQPVVWFFGTIIFILLIYALVSGVFIAPQSRGPVQPGPTQSQQITRQETQLENPTGLPDQQIPQDQPTAQSQPTQPLIPEGATEWQTFSGLIKRDGCPNITLSRPTRMAQKEQTIIVQTDGAEVYRFDRSYFDPRPESVAVGTCLLELRVIATGDRDLDVPIVEFRWTQ